MGNYICKTESFEQRLDILSNILFMDIPMGGGTRYSMDSLKDFHDDPFIRYASTCDNHHITTVPHPEEGDLLISVSLFLDIVYSQRIKNIVTYEGVIKHKFF